MKRIIMNLFTFFLGVGFLVFGIAQMFKGGEFSHIELGILYFLFGAILLIDQHSTIKDLENRIKKLEEKKDK